MSAELEPIFQINEPFFEDHRFWIGSQTRHYDESRCAASI